jgi:hypothetical protein
MANSSAVTNKVRGFERLLLPVGRRVAEIFSKAFMFCLPNVSDETTTAIFTANRENRVSAGLNQSGTKLFEGFEPGRIVLSLIPLVLPAHNASPALPGAAMPMQCTPQKIV